MSTSNKSCNEVFSYNVSNLKNLLTNDNKNTRSPFDEKLISRWNAAHTNNVCNYTLNACCKVLPGKYGFVVQLNDQRKNRRAPEAFYSVKMPFNDKKFNFSKVNQKEKLFYVQKNIDSSIQDHTTNGKLSDQKVPDNVLVINVSPFAVGHALLVPNISECRPQILTIHAVELALEVQCLSALPNFVIVYNGMCAHASVNHLHLHCYYLQLTDNQKQDSNSNEISNYVPKPHLITQSQNLSFSKISKHCFVCKSLPVPAIVFQILVESDIGEVARDVIAVTSYLVDENIAHNMSIVKARAINPQNHNATVKDSSLNAVRLFLWPRRLVTGAKTENCLNIGSCELAGHIFVQTPEAYNTASEDELADSMSKEKLPESEFDFIVARVRDLITK